MFFELIDNFTYLKYLYTLYILGISSIVIEKTPDNYEMRNTPENN